jgi:hypothetical protein
MTENNEYYNKIIKNFIPIVILFLFIFHSNEFIKYSDTVLGKLLAVLIIIYYTTIDTLIGLFVCVIIILFYQTIHCKGLDNIENYKNVKKENMETLFRTQFENEYCENGNLMYKGTKIKKDIIPHIFPEIKFVNELCNPCDVNCEYNVIEEDLINKHREMITPQNSKDWLWTAFNSVIGNGTGENIKETNPMKSIGVITEPFSFLS